MVVTLRIDTPLGPNAMSSSKLRTIFATQGVV